MVRAMARALQGRILATVLVAIGCPRTGDGNVPDRPSGDPQGDRVLRVGNPSRGVDEQPDYEGLARRLHDDVAPRLPSALPPVRDACAEMLDAAVAMYRRTEADAKAQVDRLTATRAADLAACEATTSAAAATCVTILVGEDAGELPWLLDQCMRAFPRG
jgi:hypothetical protein